MYSCKHVFTRYNHFLPVINFSIWTSKILIIFGTKTKEWRLNNGLRTKRENAATKNSKSG
jgi:hypothetical protein